MSAGERDVWREWFAELALTMDQASAYLWTGNKDDAKSCIDSARHRVEAARTKLDAHAGALPAFRPTEPPEPPLESQYLRLIGMLVAALESDDLSTKHTAMKTLTRWLPRIAAGDGEYLNRWQRQRLCRWLRMENAPANPEWITAIIRALTKIGDMGALPHLQRLADSAAVTVGGKRVKTEAESGRVQLEMLQARSEVNKTLLRASNAPSDDLLRPADSRGTGDETQLLRPFD